MDKRSKNILSLFGAFLILIIVIEIMRPQPVNWRPSYTAQDKIPFGCYVMHRELQDLMQVDEIIAVNESPYTFLLGDAPTVATEGTKSYIFINNNLYFDTEETTALMDFVEEGNSAFISASYIYGDLSDSLKFQTFTENVYREIENKAYLYSPAFENQYGTYKRGVYKTYFTEIDTLNTIALGYFISEEEDENDGLVPDEQINFIKIPRGDGYFYIHTLPQAFSNYYLLNGNETYAAQVLSHFETESLLWDEYYKSGRRYIETPMRYILSEGSLKWAYYLTVFGIILFVVFKGKRLQRIIPVINPLENTTVEFTKTIGDLYFQNRNYTNIINKKITYFLERVRSKFYVDTQKIDISFAEKLAQKNGKSKESVIALIHLINELKQKPFHTEEDLITLNKELEKFEH
tara:strand:- start:16573 stop:17787 length:1215 start_codon:yes stop_codon:yes gene_type:complete